MKQILLLIAALAFIGGSARADKFGGVVSDTHCGNKHSNADAQDTACVKKCVGQGAKYVLEYGGQVLQLDHQEMFAKYAGWLVMVEGTRHGDSISVKSVTPELHNQ